MDNNIVCAKCAGRGYYFASESSTLRTPCSCQESPKKALINAMSVNAANLNHIASSGKINGTLMVETERILEEYAEYRVKQLQEDVERLRGVVKYAHNKAYILFHTKNAVSKNVTTDTKKLFHCLDKALSGKESKTDK